jgi:hypothetical protein
MFERRSQLVRIDSRVFFDCGFLHRLLIPASVTTIDGTAFLDSSIRSIGIEEGSVSFRVVNGLLVDFEVRLLVWVIGSPESIVIPSSIETLGPFCCAEHWKLNTVEFEPDSNLQTIGESAFDSWLSLESIWIPSSVEILRKHCFFFCSNLRTVTFGPESALRVIEEEAFGCRRSLTLVSVPASAEVIHQSPFAFVSRQ